MPVPAYELFNSTELLGRLAMEKALAGLSTHRYGPVGLEPVGEQVSATARSTSKSAVSRKFVAQTERRWPSCCLQTWRSWTWSR